MRRKDSPQITKTPTTQKLNHTMKRHHILTAIGLFGSIATSQAAFNILDDFESYATGSNIGAATNWTSTLDGGPDHTVAESSGNKYLSLSGTNNTHSVFNNNSTLLADGAAGTYFFRMLTATTGSHGGTGVSAKEGFQNGWSDGGAIIRLGDRSDQRPGNVNKLYAYNENSGGAGTYDEYSVLTTDVWYNAWIVLDNDGDRQYDFYIQRDGDSTYGTQTQLGSGLGYRDDANTAVGSIESLFFRTGLTNVGTSFDDLYFDGSGPNLANPVPEPTVTLLGALGLLGLLRRRR
jgi:MYXO-CTERM domain-containing protein